MFTRFWKFVTQTGSDDDTYQGQPLGDSKRAQTAKNIPNGASNHSNSNNHNNNHQPSRSYSAINNGISKKKNPTNAIITNEDDCSDITSNDGCNTAQTSRPKKLSKIPVLQQPQYSRDYSKSFQEQTGPSSTCRTDHLDDPRVRQTPSAEKGQKSQKIRSPSKDEINNRMRSSQTPSVRNSGPQTRNGASRDGESGTRRNSNATNSSGRDSVFDDAAAVNTSSGARWLPSIHANADTEQPLGAIPKSTNGRVRPQDPEGSHNLATGDRRRPRYQTHPGSRNYQADDHTDNQFGELSQRPRQTGRKHDRERSSYPTNSPRRHQPAASSQQNGRGNQSARVYQTGRSPPEGSSADNQIEMRLNKGRRVVGGNPPPSRANHDASYTRPIGDTNPGLSESMNYLATGFRMLNSTMRSVSVSLQRLSGNDDETLAFKGKKCASCDALDERLDAMDAKVNHMSKSIEDLTLSHDDLDDRVTSNSSHRSHHRPNDNSEEEPEGDRG